MADCEAQLDVGLDFARVGRSVEASELYRSFLPYCVEVECVVSAEVVVVCCSAHIAVVPQSADRILACRFSLVDFLDEVGVYLTAVVVLSVSAYSECLEEQVFFACHYVGDVSERPCCVGCRIDVDVDSAGAVGDCTFVSQLSDYLLYRLDVFVGADGRDQLAFVFVIVHALTAFKFCGDA